MALPISLRAHGAVGRGLKWVEGCMLKWVEGCMAAPDEASCAACTKGLSADCPLLLQVLINQEVCNHAPFTTSTEECINAAVASCGSFTTSKKACHACILKKKACHAPSPPLAANFH